MTRLQTCALIFMLFAFVFACGMPGPDNEGIAWDPLVCFAGVVLSWGAVAICLLVDKALSYRLPHPDEQKEAR